MSDMNVTEKIQGYYCQYCGKWNSYLDKKCTFCGADYTPDTNNETPFWNDVDPPRKKSILPAILIACLITALATITVVYIITKNNNSENPKYTQEDPAASASEAAIETTAETTNDAATETAPETTNDAAIETTAETTNETGEVSTESKEDTHEYTAHSLRLTSFGGETTGDELAIHSPVYDNYKNKYDAGLGGTRSGVENVTEYLIGDQYKYLSFRVVLNYERRTDYHPDTYVRIYADGSQIYKSKPVANRFKPEDVTLDIRGVEKIKVGICGNADIRIVDAVLHNDEGYEQYSTMEPYSNKRDSDSVPLIDLEYWSGSSAEGGLRYLPATRPDSQGNQYTGSFAGTHPDQNNWVEYDITDCGYTKLTGTIIMNMNPAGKDEITPVLTIYDATTNEQLYRSDPVMPGSKNQHIDVNLKNTTKFRLQISGKYNVRLVDCYLTK